MVVVARVAVFEAGIFFDEAHPHITGFTVADTVRFNLDIRSCQINYPEVPGDSVKVQYRWEMGDIDNTVYTAPTPAFRYTEAGDYEVKVSIFYPGWAVQREDTLFLTVNPLP